MGLTAALLLNRRFAWRGLARMLVVVPWALPSVIIGLVWTWMLDFNLGLLNEVGIRVGLLSAPVPWLSQPGTALAAVILAVVWQGFPFFTVTLLAGLQAIPHELYEAASLDGAGAVAKFRHVTLPGVAAVMTTALLLRMIWVANSLDLILVMTGGGPGTSTQTLPLHAFLTAWSGGNYGQGSALAVMLTLLLLGVRGRLCAEPPGMRRLKLLLGTELPVVAILMFALVPWGWMALSSLRPDADLTRTPLQLLPDTLTLANHIELLRRTSFAENLRDSLIVAVGAVVLGLMLSLPAAYAFSRFRFRGRDALLVQFLVINMFPVVVLILPLFVLFRQFGLLDTYVALIAGHATFTLPFAIWLMTGYVDGIPAELDQAAAIDGATRWQIMRLVVLPLALPGLVAVGIYLFIASWNEYLFALMLAGRNVRTVTIALQSFIGENQVQWGLLMAGGTLVALPATILFLLTQGRLVGGLTGGAVKG